ncbi:lycopene cyclase family protein [Hyunsoonleella rubra]|uniref:Lycopene cyclase family protein n=1 Tax=Hyunsoonleella rubra TaxID=1737062 RepID=A0ABW5TAA8_9FLAO
MSGNTHFDYVIIGSGLAGLQLALKMASDSFFDDKTIALIDASKKNSNDKTWSFWETEPSQWNHILHQSWKQAKVITSKNEMEMNLSPYAYKTIRAIDFYKYAKSTLENHQNFQFLVDEVVYTHEDSKVIVKTKKRSYTAEHVFDSRIPVEFYNNNKSLNINQHFKGIVIKTEREVFDAKSFTMMDYRLKDGEQTSFTYVLPFSKHEALVEFTYFTEHIVETSVYDGFLQTYIKKYLKIDDYKIIESEQGNIPMSTFPFDKFNTEKITKIGTGGGWVKPSTGYSFKHTEKKVAKVLDNIKANKRPSDSLFSKKYRFFDTVFLKVLKEENHKGEWIFNQFYSRNRPASMFRFLDEESSVKEELKIMVSLFSWSFVKAFFKTL